MAPARRCRGHALVATSRKKGSVVLRVNAEEFRKAVNLVQPFAGLLSPREDYAAVALWKEVNGGNVTLKLRTLSGIGICGASVSIKDDGEWEVGKEVYVPVRKLKEIVGNISDEEISIGSTEAALNVRTGSGTIRIRRTQCEHHAISTFHIQKVKARVADLKSELEFLYCAEKEGGSPGFFINGGVSTSAASECRSIGAWSTPTAFSFEGQALISPNSARVLSQFLKDISVEECETWLGSTEKGSDVASWLHVAAGPDARCGVRTLEIDGRIRRLPQELIDQSFDLVGSVAQGELLKLLKISRVMIEAENTEVVLKFLKDKNRILIQKEATSIGDADMFVEYAPSECNTAESQRLAQGTAFDGNKLLTALSKLKWPTLDICARTNDSLPECLAFVNGNQKLLIAGLR